MKANIEKAGVPIDGAQCARAVEGLRRFSELRDRGRTLPPDHPLVVTLRESAEAAAEQSDALRVCDHVRGQIHKVY